MKVTNFLSKIGLTARSALYQAAYVYEYSDFTKEVLQENRDYPEYQDRMDLIEARRKRYGHNLLGAAAIPPFVVGAVGVLGTFIAGAPAAALTGTIAVTAASVMAMIYGDKKSDEAFNDEIKIQGRLLNKDALKSWRESNPGRPDPPRPDGIGVPGF